ncbi:hypothetical protein LCGC14_1414510 [marine sediment metagenome]|uniref:DUF669 domain-containing protein n=1 Tax=marine sediment metagenome TaxID=412755 RepID=A0A0F9MUY7_9ZZZZ
MVQFDKPLDEVEDQEFGSMPEGEYLGFVDDAEDTKSNAGDDMLHLTIKLAGNPKYNRKFVHYYLVDKEDSEFYLPNAKKLAKHFNLEVKGTKEIKAEVFKGLPCKFKTKPDTYTNKDGNEVPTDRFHYWVAIDDGEAQSAAAEKVEEIDLGDDIPF